MCDDLEPGDFFEDDRDEDEQAGDPAEADEREPTPGERLFYALGQLYRLYRHGALNVRPMDFDVWDLAGIIGVRGDIEFVSADQLGAHYHFADEVLQVGERPDSDFPWRLLGVWDWAAEQELNSYWTDWWD